MIHKLKDFIFSGTYFWQLSCYLMYWVINFTAIMMCFLALAKWGTPILGNLYYRCLHTERQR